MKTGLSMLHSFLLFPSQIAFCWALQMLLLMPFLTQMPKNFGLVLTITSCPPSMAKVAESLSAVPAQIMLFKHLNEPTHGIPLKFSPVNHNYRVVRLNTDLNIKFVDFHHPKKCKESKVWKFDANKQIPLRQSFITTGGIEGQTGSQGLPNRFKIQKFEDANRLQYCPSQELCHGPCIDQTIVCRDIGSLFHNGERRLAVQP